MSDEPQDTNIIGRYSGNEPPAINVDPEAAAAFKATVPESFRDKPYMKDIVSMEALMTKFDGAETLIGKTGRVTIPQDGATPDELSSFYSAIGRPESPDKYESPFEAESPIFEKLRDTFFKNGITSKQAKNIMSSADSVLKEIAGQQDATSAERDTEFGDMMKGMFGDKVDQATANASALVKKFAPESVKPYLNDLGNKELLLLTSVLNGIHKEHFSEDNSVFDTNGLQANNSIAEIDQEINDNIKKAQDKTFTHAQQIEFSNRANELVAQKLKLQGGK